MSIKSATTINPMDLALDQAAQAAERGEVPVGAVVVSSDSTVLAADGNRIKELNDPTAHAEMLVLRTVAKQLGNERLMECDLYVTLEPCTMCAGAIALARIRRIYYGAADEKTGACDHGIRFFEQKSCHHHPEIYGGINEIACAEMLKDFFAKKRS